MSQSKLRLWALSLYGAFPVSVLLPLSLIAHERGAHLTRPTLNIGFVAALAYVVLGAWMAYSLTQVAVQRDQKELGQ